MIDRRPTASTITDSQLDGLYARLERAEAALDREQPAPDTAATQATNDTELTAEEARALADELGTDLYRAQDALAFVGECCDIADREQRTITTDNVREWLKGARCGRQLAADGHGLGEKWARPPSHRITAATRDPEVERAATERAVQAAAASEKAAAWLAQHIGPEPARDRCAQCGDRRHPHRACDPDHLRTELAWQQAVNSDYRVENQALRDKLARLHEGEEPHTDELTEATPAQWIWRWNRATPAERLEVAATFKDNAAIAWECVGMDHEARLHDQKHATIALNEVRHVIVDMQATTGARFWADALARAVAHPEKACLLCAAQPKPSEETPGA